MKSAFGGHPIVVASSPFRMTSNTRMHRSGADPDHHQGFDDGPARTARTLRALPLLGKVFTPSMKLTAHAPVAMVWYVVDDQYAPTEVQLQDRSVASMQAVQLPE